MAESIRDDYKNMIDSIKEYGGFYVGRYELGKNGNVLQVKSGTVVNDLNWYNAYVQCKTFGNDKVESRMIWGCQWDQVCKFVSTAKDANGDSIDLNDSIKYGNYKNSQSPADTNSGSGVFNKTTGRNEAWKLNNIYDLAGNCAEWTQEAQSSNIRVVRGGSRSEKGADRPIIFRDRAYSYISSSTYSSRPVLYLK